MEYTIWYDVDIADKNVIASSATLGIELDEEQILRVRTSYESGKFLFMEEDDTLRDIVDEVYNTAVQLEEQSEYGELVGTELDVKNFHYPEELKEED